MKKENVLRHSEEMRERENEKKNRTYEIEKEGKELRKQRETVEGNKGGSILYILYLCVCVCLKV